MVGGLALGPADRATCGDHEHHHTCDAVTVGSAEACRMAVAALSREQEECVDALQALVDASGMFGCAPVVRIAASVIARAHSCYSRNSRCVGGTGPKQPGRQRRRQRRGWT